MIAAGFMAATKVESGRHSVGSPLATMSRALKHAVRDANVRRTLLLIGTSGTFFLSVKWFFNPLLQGLHLPLPLWGTVIGATLGLPLAGIWIYRHTKREQALWPAVLMYGVIIAPLGLTSIGLWPLAALFAAMVIFGYLNIDLNVRLNEAIQIKERASILSLASLLQRAGTSLYTPLAGLVLAHYSMKSLMLGTAMGLMVIMLPLALRLAKPAILTGKS